MFCYHSTEYGHHIKKDYISIYWFMIYQMLEVYIDVDSLTVRRFWDRLHHLLLGPFSVEFVCSRCVCVGSLWLPPTVQRHADCKLPIGVNMSMNGCLSLCQACDTLAACLGCNLWQLGWAPASLATLNWMWKRIYRWICQM